MEFYANEGKQVEIRVGKRTFARHAVKTHFVQLGEDYIELVRNYILPVYQPGDLVSLSEKVISLCQTRVLYEDDVRPGMLARFLCRFVHKSPAGPGLSIPYKMQFAINQRGSVWVVLSAIAAGFGKLVGKKGVFYTMLGIEISGLDGFYGNDIREYAHMGIMIPDQPDRVCDEIYRKTGVRVMIVDANGLNVEILGRASVVKEDAATLAGMIRDNPAGQARHFKPFIMIRETTGKALCPHLLVL